MYKISHSTITFYRRKIININIIPIPLSTRILRPHSILQYMETQEQTNERGTISLYHENFFKNLNIKGRV